MDYNPSEVERRWQKRWEEAGVYEVKSSTDATPKTIVSTSHPYPSAGVHVGHARIFLFTDIYARYRRMQGDRVLFPWTWHVSGIPLVRALKRVKLESERQREFYRTAYDDDGAALDTLKSPIELVEYFIREHDKQILQALGLSIDWSREFTTNDDRYSKFVSWQYERLHDQGVLNKSQHPVRYCLAENQPVTVDDLTQQDVEIQKYSLVRFQYDGTVVPAMTNTPETAHGATNLFIDPASEYVRIAVEDEEWVLSAEGAEKVALQDSNVETIARFDGAELVGTVVENPITSAEVVILPSPTVEADLASGIKMSVPAHDPEAYLVYRDLLDSAKVGEYNINADDLPPIEASVVLDVPGYGRIPAREILEAKGVTTIDDPAMKDAVQQLQTDQQPNSVLIDSTEQFADKCIETIQSDFRARHEEDGTLDSMYDIEEDVDCLCGGDIVVSRQETWFLKYDELTACTRDAIDAIECVPANLDQQFYDFLDKLEEWPCTRNYGLGTQLPWDTEHIVGPLSDSTLITAYQTLAPALQEVPVEDLTPEFFDVVFYGSNGEDAPEDISIDIADPSDRALTLRDIWKDWYPVDLRCDAGDLVQNYLTFFLSNHACLFDRSNWPKQIIINGMVLIDGEKMSFTENEAVPAQEAINDLGADTIRLFLSTSTAPWQPLDWNPDRIDAGTRLLQKLWNASKLVERQISAPNEVIPPERLDDIDRWILAKLDQHLKSITEHLERYEFSKAGNELKTFFWSTFCDDYLEIAKNRDNDSTKFAVVTAHMAFLKLFAPFIPHITEEIWQRMYAKSGGDLDSIHIQDWPEPGGYRADIDAGETAMNVISALRNYKSNNGLALNTNLEHVKIYGDVDGFEDAIAEAMHIENLEIFKQKSEVTTEIEEIDLNYEKVGPVYGESIPEIESAIANGEFELTGDRLNIGSIELEEDMFEITETHVYSGEGVLVEANDVGVVVVD